MSKCRICIAAMQHYIQVNNTTSLFVVFDWPTQRRTDWAVSFPRVLQLAIVLHLVDQITNERSHHKSNEQGNVNQRPSDPPLLQQFVRPALTTVWTSWRIIGTVVTTAWTLYK
jgi:hypothetical protein